MNGKKKSKPKKLRLNLGSGSEKILGYVNVDIRKECNPDLVCDIRKLPYDENTVDRILASDALEHVGRLEVKSLLEHWHKMLKPGGVLIIKTPNMDTIMNMYLRKKIPFEEMVRKIYGGQEYKGNYHFVIFNPPTLIFLLESIGFKIIHAKSRLDGGDWSNMAIRCQK